MEPEYFLKRLTERALSRYGVRITQSRVEDLIAEYLVPPAERSGPTAWARDCKSYRRALEVCRIESRAPPGRRLLMRNIRIQQWLSGRPIPEQVIRDDVRQEFGRSARELLRMLRNVLPVNMESPINENQSKTMRHNMGEVSPKIVPTEFHYDTSELVALLSLVTSGHTGIVQIAGKEISPEEAITQIFDRWGFANLFGRPAAKFIASVLACILADPDEFESTGVSILSSATSEQLNNARELSRAMPRIIENIPDLISAFASEQNAENLVGPCKNIAMAVRDQQQWRFLLFIIMLMTVSRSGDEIQAIADLLPK